MLAPDGRCARLTHPFLEVRAPVVAFGCIWPFVACHCERNNRACAVLKRAQWRTDDGDPSGKLHMAVHRHSSMSAAGTISAEPRPAPHQPGRDDIHAWHAPRGGIAALTVGALGVVYGDIGTSPLYAVNEIFFGHGHVTPTPGNVLGCISLVLWALTVVVALRYIVYVLRADNDGEGGVL